MFFKKEAKKLINTIQNVAVVFQNTKDKMVNMMKIIRTVNNLHCKITFCPDYKLFLEKIKNGDRFSLAIFDIPVNSSITQGQVKWWECVVKESQISSYFFVYDSRLPIIDYIQDMRHQMLRDKEFILNHIRFAFDVSTIGESALLKTMKLKIEHDQKSRKVENQHEIIENQHEIILKSDKKNIVLSKELEKKEILNKQLEQKNSSVLEIVKEMVASTISNSNCSSDILTEAISILDNDNFSKQSLLKLLYQAKAKAEIATQKISKLIVFCEEQVNVVSQANIKDALEYASSNITTYINNKCIVDMSNIPSCVIDGSPMIIKKLLKLIYIKYFSNPDISTKSIDVSVETMIFKKEILLNLNFETDQEINFFSDQEIKLHYNCLKSNNYVYEFDSVNKKLKIVLFFNKA